MFLRLVAKKAILMWDNLQKEIGKGQTFVPYVVWLRKTLSTLKCLVPSLGAFGLSYATKLSFDVGMSNFFDVWSRVRI